MVLRMAFPVAIVIALATLLFAQPKTVPVDHIDNNQGMAWLVRYDKNEDVSHFPKSKRIDAAVRLQISKTNGKYFAKLRRFEFDTGGKTKYKLKDAASGGKFDNVELHIQGNKSGRKRVAFWSDPQPIPATNPTHRLTINGIWQPGHNKTREHDRIQLKLFIVPAVAAAAQKAKLPFSCDEDPDTDVLEETTAPPGDDDPPPYDGDM
jgi:hypothetical protein